MCENMEKIFLKEKYIEKWVGICIWILKWRQLGIFISKRVIIANIVFIFKYKFPSNKISPRTILRSKLKSSVLSLGKQWVHIYYIAIVKVLNISYTIFQNDFSMWSLHTSTCYVLCTVDITVSYLNRFSMRDCQLFSSHWAIVVWRLIAMLYQTSVCTLLCRHCRLPFIGLTLPFCKLLSRLYIWSKGHNQPELFP